MGNSLFRMSRNEAFVSSWTNWTHIVSIRIWLDDLEDFISVQTHSFVIHYSFLISSWACWCCRCLERTVNDCAYLREYHLSKTILCQTFLQNLASQRFSIHPLNTENEVRTKQIHWNPLSLSNYLECQQSQLALFVRFSMVSKTDGTKVCPETWLCNTVANWEVQMVAWTSLLKDKSTFKGNKWGKMPGR